MKSILSESVDLKNNTEYQAIDIAKMICALMVVSIHIDLFGKNNPIDILNVISIVSSEWLSRIAVPFFFMASGFFLFCKIPYENFEMISIWKYVKRIAFLYLLWSLIYFPLEMKELGLGNKSYFSDMVTYMYHFLFIGSYTHLWYLPALISAVILVSVCINKKIDLHKIIIIALFFYLIGILGNSWYGLTNLVVKHFSLKYNLLNMVLRVFSTTRNGIFYAFLFVALGAYCAYGQINISKTNAGILFLIFYGMMLIETIVLYRLNFSLGRDMTLCLVPTVFFLFLFVSQIRIRNDYFIYKKLRFCSSVTYFLHMFVWALVSKIFSMMGLTYLATEDNPFMYWIVIFLCVVGTGVIDLISQIKNLNWIKRLF